MSLYVKLIHWKETYVLESMLNTVLACNLLLFRFQIHVLEDNPKERFYVGVANFQKRILVADFFKRFTCLRSSIFHGNEM